MVQPVGQLRLIATKRLLLATGKGMKHGLGKKFSNGFKHGQEVHALVALVAAMLWPYKLQCSRSWGFCSCKSKVGHPHLLLICKLGGIATGPIHKWDHHQQVRDRLCTAPLRFGTCIACTLHCPNLRCGYFQVTATLACNSESWQEGYAYIHHTCSTRYSVSTQGHIVVSTLRHKHTCPCRKGTLSLTGEGTFSMAAVATRS
jgi:hypothetical protein